MSLGFLIFVSFCLSNWLCAVLRLSLANKTHNQIIYITHRHYFCSTFFERPADLKKVTQQESNKQYLPHTWSPVALQWGAKSIIGMCIQVWPFVSYIFKWMFESGKLKFHEKTSQKKSLGSFFVPFPCSFVHVWVFSGFFAFLPQSAQTCSVSWLVPVGVNVNKCEVFLLLYVNPVQSVIHPCYMSWDSLQLPATLYRKTLSKESKL